MESESSDDEQYDTADEDFRPPTPPKCSAVVESYVGLERETSGSPDPAHSPIPPPNNLTMIKTYVPEAQPYVTSEPSSAQSTLPPPLCPNRASDQSTNKSPQSIHLSSSGLLHDQQGPHLQNQQEGPSLPTWHPHEHLSGAQGATGDRKPHGYEGYVQMPSSSDGQQNWAHGAYGQPNWNSRVDGHVGHHVQPPWGHQPWGQPHMPYGPHAQYWPHWPSIYPVYGNQIPHGMPQGSFPRMDAGGSFCTPPYFPSQEPIIGETYNKAEIQNQNHYQHQKQEQQQQQQHMQQQQCHQTKLHVQEGEASGQAILAEPNREQEEKEKQEKREITNRQSQNSVGSSPQPAMKKEEEEQGKGAKSAHTESEQIASEQGYIMVIGLNESTSYDNLWNFIEGKSDADLKEIIFGPRRENAVVIFENKPDHVNLQDKVSKKPLNGNFLEVLNMSPPTSIIVSTKDPNEFSIDTLTLHFESKKYGGAALVEDGIKMTEDGCYIMTFTDSDATERVCAIQHEIKNTPLNVSPYYQCKKWAAWNTAIHEINIPEPFVHKVDPVLFKYLQSFPRAMKAVQMAMVKMHAGIELQENAVLLTCLLNPEVKGCRKLLTSWRKNAEEHWSKLLSSTFQVEKISNLSEIWDDFMDFVKSMIKDKEIMLVEERFENYIQLIGFYEEVKTADEEIKKERLKLERIKKVGIEIFPLKSAAKKRLLDRDGIFQMLGAQFSDLDVSFEQPSEDIVLSGVPEDRNNAKLLIFEELRKFSEPFVICDSTEHFSQFIKEGAPRNYIIKEMETNGLMVDWDVCTENGHVYVYCIPADCAQHAATQMKKMVREINIPLSESAQLFVTTEEWMMYQAETESKCDGLVHVVVTNDLTNIIWISMEDLYADILEELKDFIKKNAVVEEMIQLTPVTKKFMKDFWVPDDYKDIEKNSGDNHLQLTWQGDSLTVRGTAEGIQKAKKLWKEKTSKIISKLHTLKRIGIKEVFTSEAQTGILKALEKEHRCLIQTENSHEEQSRDVEMDERERVCDTVNELLIGNVKISQTVEELENQQVDAILCSCAENLVLSQSGACAALLHVGGQTLQDECKINYPNGIKQGQIAIIGGGNLKCKHVFFTALPQYTENGEKALFDVVTASLQLAAEKGCKSIAMPAMGSGNLKYPAASVAKVMYDAVGDWAKKNTTTSLKVVNFVLFLKDKSTRDAFRDQLRGILPNVNIRLQKSVSVDDVKTLPKNSSCIIIDPSDDSVCTVGKMKVKVYTGDILKETTDAIVNSVGADFSFHGGVSVLLKQTCPGLEKECQDKVIQLRQSGVVMTDSFGLKCKKIFHVKFQDNLTGWKMVMKKCLEEASQNKLSSVAFPVLGTGAGYISFPADKIAQVFFEALINFDDETKAHQVQQVNVVVYHKQPQLIPAIKKGMVMVSNKGPGETIGRTWYRHRDVGCDVQDIVMPQSGLVGRQWKSTLYRSQVSQVTLQVYSDSELNINCCIASLEKKLDMAYTSTPLNDDLIGKMNPQELEEFFKTELLVECEFIQEEKKVLIRGTKQNVSRALNQFQEKLRNRTRKESEKEEAEKASDII